MLCISFPIKVSKFPQFLYLPTARRNAEDQSLSAPTSHRCRRSPEKGAARTFPTEVEALKQLKRNKHKTCRIGPFGASAGDTVSSSDSNGRWRETRSSLRSGSMPSPHASGTATLSANLLRRVRAGAETLSLPCPSQNSHRPTGIYTNSVKSSTEEMRRFLCPVS